MRYYPGFAHLFDDFFNDSISSQSGALKTDITEKDGMYILEMEVPGYKKEDIQIELDQGYLKVQASRSDEKVNTFVKNVMSELVPVASMSEKAINKKTLKPVSITEN